METQACDQEADLVRDQQGDQPLIADHGRDQRSNSGDYRNHGRDLYCLACLAIVRMATAVATPAMTIPMTNTPVMEEK